MSGIQLRLIELAAVIIAIFCGVAYERHRGAQVCLAADAHAVAAQTIRSAQTAATAIVEVAQEKVTLHDQTSAPIVDAPVVRVCLPARQTSAMPKAGATGQKPDGATLEPIADIASADIGKPLVTIGRNADAQIRALQDYVAKVCLAKP